MGSEMFKTIRRQYRIWKAKQRLDQYVKTLSPEKQKEAYALRDKLQRADARQSIDILLQYAGKVSIAHHRLTEKLHSISSK